MPATPIDITQQINKRISSLDLIFPVDDRLIGKSVTSKNKENKKLRLVYSVAGEMFEWEIPEGKTVNLAQHNPEPKLAIKNGKLTWITPQTGTIECIMVSGDIKKGCVKSIPQPLKMGC